MRQLLLLLRRSVLLLVLAAGALAPAAQVARADGWWAQTLRAVNLWSGPDSSALSFGELSRGDFLFVVDPQPFPGGARLYVLEPQDRTYGYVDAIALAPSGPPPGQAAGGAAVGPVVGGPLFQPFWVANFEATTLWTAPSAGGESAGDLPQFSKLLVLSPASGPRYYVQDARTERLGYVEAAVVGPSAAPTAEELAPPPVLAAPPAPSYRPWWVAAFRPADLWSGLEGGTSFGRLAIGERVLVMEPQDGPRLHVLNPKTRNYAFVDAAAVGPSDAPKAVAIDVKGWQGVVTGDVVNLRPEPHTFISPAGQVRLGDVVTVSAWVEGEELDKDNRTWARIASVSRPTTGDQAADVPLGDEPGARYLYSGLLRPLEVKTAPEPPRNALGAGGAKWIDVNLSVQVVVAYEGERVTYQAPVTSGRPGWETPTGIFRIQRRVENETMIGSTLLRLDTLEIPDYHLENVKWTQYFTGNGAALHTNYWRPVSIFAIPSSHGCLGLSEVAAKWLWDWGRIGTPLLIHY